MSFRGWQRIYKAFDVRLVSPIVNVEWFVWIVWVFANCTCLQFKTKSSVSAIQLVWTHWTLKFYYGMFLEQKNHTKMFFIQKSLYEDEYFLTCQVVFDDNVVAWSCGQLLFCIRCIKCVRLIGGSYKLVSVHNRPEMLCIILYSRKAVISGQKRIICTKNEIRKMWNQLQKSTFLPSNSEMTHYWFFPFKKGG